MKNQSVLTNFEKQDMKKGIKCVGNWTGVGLGITNAELYVNMAYLSLLLDILNIVSRGCTISVPVLFVKSTTAYCKP